MLLTWACSGEAPPLPPPSPTLALTVPLPTAAHAGSIALDALAWPTASAPDEHFCGWRRGDLPHDADALAPAIIELDASGSVRFSGSPLPIAQLEATLSAGRQRWQDADQRCIAQQGGAGIARVPEAALAAAPGATTAALVPVLSAAAAAGIERLYVLVDGPAGAALPGHFDDDDVQIHATREQLRHRQQAAPMPPAGPLPLEAVGADAARVRCALLGVGTADRWQETTGMLDRLAEAGARRAVLLHDDTLPPATAPAPAATRPPLTLDLGGAVAAHLLDIPQLVTEPDGAHVSACSPILYVAPAQ